MPGEPEELKNLDKTKDERDKQRSLMDDPKFCLPIGLAIGAIGLNMSLVGLRELIFFYYPCGMDLFHIWTCTFNFSNCSDLETNI